MSWKAFLIYSVVFLYADHAVSARQYQPGKHAILRKLRPVDFYALEHYVDEFLENNALTTDRLACVNNAMLLEWSAELAKKIEQRYCFAPSTLVNRTLFHEKKIFHILQNRRNTAQAEITQECVNWKICHEKSADTVALRTLMDRYAQGENICSENIQEIEKRLEQLHPEDRAEKNHLRQVLVQVITNLHDHHHAVLESFAGAPMLSMRKKLATQWQILAREEEDLNQNLSALLRHSQILHQLNKTMHEKLRFIFSNTHLGITPYTDKALGLKCEMFNKAILELGALRSTLSDKKQAMFDVVCRFVAVQLWTQWFPLFKTDMQPATKPGAQQDEKQGTMQAAAQSNQDVQKNQDQNYLDALQKDLMFLMENPLAMGHVLEKLLSPFSHNIILPAKHLDQACKIILELLRLVQQNFSNDSFCTAFSKKIPEMIQKIVGQTESWKKHDLPSVTAPVAHNPASEKPVDVTAAIQQNASGTLQGPAPDSIVATPPTASQP